MLGYGGHPDWRDMSEYVVHLTEREPMREILNQRVWKPGGPMGTARNLRELADSQDVVCLSEIPLDRLDRLMERHGHFGLGFRKRFVRSKGGAPVWYLNRDTPMQGTFQTVINEAMQGGVDPSNTIWKLTPFIENPGSGDWRRYEFDWEREWRVVGDFTFGNANIRFLIAPESAHVSVAADWEQRVTTGRAVPPLIDLGWDLSQLQDALARYEQSE